MKPVVAFSVDEELRRVAHLFDLGFEEQMKVAGLHAPRFTAMLLIAQGLERFCKLVLAFRYKVQYGSFPPAGFFREKGHRLSNLVDRVVQECFDADYLDMADARWGKVYLSSDPLFRRQLELLTTFASTERYYDLDLIEQGDLPDISPERRWAEIEESIGDKQWPEIDDRLRLLNSPGGYQGYNRLCNEGMVASIKRAAYALARILAAGPVDREAKRYHGTYSHMLREWHEGLDYRAYLNP